jgi:hypothetical protein
MKQITLKHIKGIFKTASRARGSFRLINPDREWWVSVGITLLVTSVLIAVAAYEFRTQHTVDTMPVVDTTRIPQYPSNAAQAVLEVYEMRRKVFDEAGNYVPDPALTFEREVQAALGEDDVKVLPDDTNSTSTETVRLE